MYEQEYNRFPVRRNPRSRQIDYTSVNYYFVTICTRKHTCIFGKPGQPNRLGKIAELGLCNIPDHFPGTRVAKYAVMPNHEHAIIAMETQGTNLSVIRNQKEYERIWLYIDANPDNWEKDCFFTDKEEKQTASAGS